jgi:hypothetical protein
MPPIRISPTQNQQSWATQDDTLGLSLTLASQGFSSDRKPEISIKSCQIELISLIFNSDLPGLELFMQRHPTFLPEIINLFDFRGNTPLSLAVKLANLEEEDSMKGIVLA